MKQLILSTAAYAAFSNDAAANKLSHAYMLHLNDAGNLREVLKMFALKFFGLTGEELDGRRLLNESLPDCRIYPPEGKKLAAENIADLLAESVMQPLERDKKLFIISGFNDASVLIQNKLLKTLEEPPRGVYFLLGVTSVAPVLDTVKSRVKTLTIPPFTPAQIFAALERKGKNDLNADAAESCGGVFGVAENMIKGGWFGEVRKAAEEICSANKISDIGEIAVKYGDTKYKAELLAETGRIFHAALCGRVRGGKQKEIVKKWTTPALIYAVESVDKACSDVKFNAYFQGLLYDLMLRIIEENNKWLKLQA